MPEEWALERFGPTRLLRRSEVTQLGRMHEGNRLGSAQIAGN